MQTLPSTVYSIPLICSSIGAYQLAREGQFKRWPMIGLGAIAVPVVSVLAIEATSGLFKTVSGALLDSIGPMALAFVGAFCGGALGLAKRKREPGSQHRSPECEDEQR